MPLTKIHLWKVPNRNFNSIHTINQMGVGDGTLQNTFKIKEWVDVYEI
jgi:hypothetical protein